MVNLLELASARTVVGDGAMGTELQRAGLPLGQGGDGWTVAHPERVRAIHQAYIAAGCDAVISNSFGANRWMLARSGLEHQVEGLNRAAAALARQAAGSAVCVLGDIGPCGLLHHPLGEVPADELLAGFHVQARALLEGGADGVIIETMSAIEELTVAIRAARAAGAPFVVASMAFDRLPDGRIATMRGVTPEQAAAVSVAEGADIVGANCGTNMDATDFVAVVNAFRRIAGCPLMVQANAGSPHLEGGRVTYRLRPDAFAAGMAEVVAAGAAIVGGCCGTTPQHIRALARQLKRGE
jgi:5-methyltetrahydrofolate--homocysteine methyltransferase